MNKYLIITRSICGIGGAEIYIRNKYVYLTNNGYDVTIISSTPGIIKIKELQKFKNFIITECMYDPFLFTDFQRKKIIKKILRIVKNIAETNLIIETSFLQASLWGELLSSRINCHNFCFFVDDIFPKINKSEYSFLLYKLKKQELVGIAKESLEHLFKNWYTLNENEHYNLNFTCSNSIELIEDSFKFDYSKYMIKIGSIGRISKGCVPSIVNGVRDFAKNNTDKNILFVMFGGNSNEKKYKKQYIHTFKGLRNIKFIITGEVFPIPFDCVNNFDLFISTAGAATATFRSGIPTLSIELASGKPLGILGFNTNSTLFKNDSDKILWPSIDNSLNDIFIKKNIDLREIRNNLSKKLVSIDYTEHLDFIFKSIKSSKKEYYTFIDYNINVKKKIIISILYTLLGGNLMFWVRKWYKGIKSIFYFK